MEKKERKKKRKKERKKEREKEQKTEQKKRGKKQLVRIRMEQRETITEGSECVCRVINSIIHFFSAFVFSKSCRNWNE